LSVIEFFKVRIDEAALTASDDAISNNDVTNLFISVVRW